MTKELRILVLVEDDPNDILFMRVKKNIATRVKF
jgi:hypothetical protein